MTADTRQEGDGWFHDGPPAASRAPTTAAVNDHEGAASAAAVVFDGVAYDDPRSLAASLQRHWFEAIDQLILRPEPALCSAVHDLLLRRGCTAALSIVGDLTQDPRARFARFLAELNPSLLPVLHGQDLRPGSIRSRLETGDSPAFIEILEDEVIPGGILTAWQGLTGMAGAAEMERALGSALDYLRRCPAPLRRIDPRLSAAIRAAVYVDALAPDLTRLRDRLAAVDTSRAATIWWWQDLSADTSSGHALSAAVHTCFLAHEQRLAIEFRHIWEAHTRVARPELREGEGVPFHELYMRRRSKKGDWNQGR